MGMFLIIWDQLFGTFQAELPDGVYESKKYGLTKPLDRPDASKIIFHEWRGIWKDISRMDIGWRDKWNYVFGPPGWSHDGSRKTSDELRREEDENALAYLKRRIPRK